MLNTDSHFNTYLVSVALEHFSNRLIGIVATDAYLRQPDYSSRAENHYFFILSDNVSQQDIWKMKYISREFPESLFNFLYESELTCYPAHCMWPFDYSNWLYKKQNHQIVMPVRDKLGEIRQAIFSCNHLSRLYYIRDLDLKTHIWGVRQFGWLVRYALQCFFNVEVNCLLDTRDIADRNWLNDLQDDWSQSKNELIDSEEKFLNAASRLSEIATRKAYFLQNMHPVTDVLMNALNHDVLSENISSRVTIVKDRLIKEIGSSLLSFYLQGSAARGDMRPCSDIDSFIIVDNISRELLRSVKNIQRDNPPFTILVYSLAEINHYPTFKRYGLVNGIKLVGGESCLNFKVEISDEIAGIINNLYTVRQISRAYLIEGSYGQRAHYIAALMAKLIDHGCLRPIQKIITGTYPCSRNEVRLFFSNTVAYMRIVTFIDSLESNEQVIKQALLKGNVGPIEHLFHDLLEAASLIEKQIKGLPY